MIKFLRLRQKQKKDDEERIKKEKEAEQKAFNEELENSKKNKN